MTVKKKNGITVDSVDRQSDVALLESYRRMRRMVMSGDFSLRPLGEGRELSKFEQLRLIDKHIDELEEQLGEDT